MIQEMRIEVTIKGLEFNQHNYRADMDKAALESTVCTWTLDEEEKSKVEVECDWPLKPATRALFNQLAGFEGLEDVTELSVRADVLSGDVIPDWFEWYMTKTEAEKAHMATLPQDPGTEFGVWYRSSRDATETKGYQQMHVRGAWFGEPFTATKVAKYQEATIIFRGREGVVHNTANEGFIPGLTEEQHERIAFVRGALKYLAERADGCFGGQADGIGVMLDEALRS